MPWQIKLFEDGSSKVLGIHLGQTTLEQAAALYGEIEGIALFSPRPDGQGLTNPRKIPAHFNASVT
jgi:hypothetical protein